MTTDAVEIRACRDDGTWYSVGVRSTMRAARRFAIRLFGSTDCCAFVRLSRRT